MVILCTHQPVKISWAGSDLPTGPVRAQSCLTLCDPTDYSPPGSPVHGIFQAKILEWFVMANARGSSGPRDWTRVSSTGRWIVPCWTTREAPFCLHCLPNNTQLAPWRGHAGAPLTSAVCSSSATPGRPPPGVPRPLPPSVRDLFISVSLLMGFLQVALVVKSPPANAAARRDASSIPGLGWSSGGGQGNPLQYSCRDNSMERGLGGYSP